MRLKDPEMSREQLGPAEHEARCKVEEVWLTAAQRTLALASIGEASCLECTCYIHHSSCCRGKTP